MRLRVAAAAAYTIAVATLPLVAGCTPAERVRSELRAPATEQPIGAAPAEAARDEMLALLRSDKELAAVVDDAERRRLQVLVAVPNGSGGLRRLAFRVDDDYFYPASAVKLCAAIGVIDKLDDLRSAPGGRTLGLGTRVRFVSSAPRRVLTTTLQAELEKSLVLSDNDAHNRLFDFVGVSELAQRLDKVGVTSARITHHLGSHDDASPPSIEMLPAGRRSIAIAQRTDFEIPPPTGQLLVGTSHIENGSTVPGPMDFAGKNIISLRDLQYLLIAVTRPDLADRGKRLLRDEGDRKRLMEILRTLPSELTGKVKRQAGSLRADVAYKPMHMAIVNAGPNGSTAVRAYGKGGRAYGFFVENLYAVDETTGKFMFVTATIYANDNGTMNDDRYEYDSIASPFMTRLGEVLARNFLGSEGEGSAVSGEGSAVSDRAPSSGSRAPPPPLQSVLLP